MIEQAVADVVLQTQDVFALWDNFYVMSVLLIIAVAGISLAGGSMAVGSYLGFLAFARIAAETDDPLLTNFLYISLVMIMLGMAFKLWRLELGGAT